MSQCDRILDALRDGEWHTSANLYDAVGGYMVLHSRISDLRHKGHTVEGRHVPGETGGKGYEYRLVDPLEMLKFVEVRRAAETPSPAVPPAEQLSIDGIPVAVPVGPDYYDI